MSDQEPKRLIGRNEQKITHIDPCKCLSVINPRSEEELEWQSLLPKILAEKGVLTTPLLVCQFDKDAPEWDTMGLSSFPKKDRETHYILIQGHRRTTSVVHIKNNRDKFPADILDNVQKVPAIVLKDISLDRAEELALDDEAKKTLKTWEVVRVVLRRLRKDHRYQDIIIDIPQLLYKALRKNGESLYAEASRITDGVERYNRFLKDLRNGVDTWIRTAFNVGPAMSEQLLLWFKKKVDLRPLLEDQTLLVDCRRQYITELQKIYNASKGDGWDPVTNISLDEAGEFVVEGGSEEVREWIKKNMREYRNPELKDKGPRMPSKSDRENVRSSGRSKVHKLVAQFFCGLPSEGRQEEDDKAFFREMREETRASFIDALCPELKALAEAESSEKDMEKFVAAYEAVDVMLRERTTV